MTRQIARITQRELRNDSGAILRAVRDEGASFIVTTNGTPVAELRPLPSMRAFPATAELISSAQNLPPVDYARFRADVDALIDQALFPGDKENGE